MQFDDQDAEQVALAGGEPARLLVVALVAHSAELGEELAELRRLVKRDSTNSSMAPSSDPPKSRAERKKAARTAYKRSMRKSGGQPGHEGKTRQKAPPERVDERIKHIPDRCECGHCFDGSEEQDGDPVIHQQWELPEIRALVLEHQRLRLRCPGCRRSRLADLPEPALSGYGPRMTAHIAALAGIYRLSRDQIRQILVEAFGAPASKGAIDAAIMRMSRVMADPWEKLHEAVKGAEIAHADETGWPLGDAQGWLWVAATSLIACYRIDPTRSQAAAKELLGADFGGIVVTDRYAGYHFLDVLQQQLCWCHLVRQLKELAAREGAAGKLGGRMLETAKKVFAVHRAYLGGGHEHAWLAEELAPLRKRFVNLLELGLRSRDDRMARFCGGLLAEEKALWTFAEIEGVEPTNNVAERAMRHGVLLRKLQGGTRSDEGARWIERVCSVRESCRLQGRSALEWMTRAAEAAYAGEVAPSLVPTALAQAP